MPIPEGAINSVLYPVAVDQNGEVMWRTVQVAEEKDEIWDDWSEGAGETKKETGRGYLWSEGFDASSPGVLRLSPHYLAHNNINLTTGYGYFMEDVETTGSTLTYDAASSGTTGAGLSSTITISHTVGTGSSRLLVVGIAHANIITSIKYGGKSLTVLGSATYVGVISSEMRYLKDPPSGTYNIVITFTSATYAAAGATSWSGVNQDTPFGTVVAATGSGTAVSVTATTSTGEFVVDTMSAPDGPTSTVGALQTERYNIAVASQVRSAGSTQAGADGGVMTWTLGTSKQWATMAAPIKPASTTSRSVMWVGDGTNMFRYTYDTSGGPTLAGTQAIASATAVGRPAKLSGKWYAPMGTGTFAYRLDNPSSDTGWVITTWEARHLCHFQKGILPTAVRAHADTVNLVEINDISAGGNVGDTWTNDSQRVGDTSTTITDLAEAGGNMFVAKEDSLYEFGTESESRNAIPFLSRGKVDSENGKGTTAFGNVILYPSKHGLWRYIIGRSARPIGVNTLRKWRAPYGITIPKGARHAQAIYVGEYLYILLNEGETSYLLQGRFRQDDDPPGHEIILHPVLTIPLSKGMGVDSLSRLWLKGASIYNNDRSIRVIELANDGSLDVTNRKGQTSTTHSIQFDERNPGRPQDLVQLRRVTVDLEGEWDTTTPLYIYMYRDNSSILVLVGTAITAAGVTTLNWTVGTSDTAYRFRPLLWVVTSSSYAPLTSDPRILRVIVGIRFPEIIKIVIPADDGALQPYGLTANIAEQNIQRLQNQGVVTFLRPGATTTFNADIMSIADTTFATPTGYSRGLEITARRWVTT